MVGPDRLRSVESFTHLGSVLSVAATADVEIKNRITKACAAFGKLRYNVWNRDGLSLATKTKVKLKSSNHPSASLCQRNLDSLLQTHKTTKPILYELSSWPASHKVVPHDIEQCRIAKNKNSKHFVLSRKEPGEMGRSCLQNARSSCSKAASVWRAH